MKELVDIINMYTWELGPRSRSGAQSLSDTVRNTVAQTYGDLCGRIMTLKEEKGIGDYELFPTEPRAVEEPKVEVKTYSKEFVLKFEMENAELRAEVERLKEWRIRDGQSIDKALALADKIADERDALKTEVADYGELFALEKPRLKRLLGERDALKAELVGSRKGMGERIETLTLEADDLRQQLAEALHKCNESDRINRAYFELRSRIEALADEWDNGEYRVVSAEFRALLQPPKGEAALDVLARIETKLEDGDTCLDADLAKLRALLEEGK